MIVALRLLLMTYVLAMMLFMVWGFDNPGLRAAELLWGAALAWLMCAAVHAWRHITRGRKDTHQVEGKGGA